MFAKILIANRGEIACRVIRTAKKMGIQTVAVYSDADKNALHVQLADEAVNIGLAPSNKSYLVMQNIIEAAKKTNSDAVHPGYGFLSENSQFPLALEEFGISFIGPPSQAIEAMGDKIASKKLASAAGVSTVPGYLGEIENDSAVVEIAEEIGYPVMIKASAGGGGKGMRIAYNSLQVKEGFMASRNEALKSFGDERLFVEKFISNPHHIEIQILGDKYGNFVYFGERECSIQRRNQKVIEEAPSPFISNLTRHAMGEQAVLLASEVGYYSAGTVEFIVDQDQNFYFLEMNTRLQVEHPVTELVYGIDLVEQMISVACGEKLAFKQSGIKPKGWAIESRIYAEDPYRSFLPSVGRLVRFRPPIEINTESQIIRNDTGVFEGGEISIYYDPMISKLCSWGKSRVDALDTMRTALDMYEIEGISHNLPFLSAVIDNIEFVKGNYTTAFIDTNYPDGFLKLNPSYFMEIKLISIAACIYCLNEERKLDVSDNSSGNSAKFILEVSIIFNEKRLDATVSKENNRFNIDFADNKKLDVVLDWVPGQILVNASVNKETITAKVKANKTSLNIYYRDVLLKMKVLLPRQADLLGFMIKRIQADTSKLLLCPMPGLLISLLVKAGDVVESGQALCTVEAMKMENILRSEKRGVIKNVNVVVGSSLSVDDTIIEFE